MRELVKADRVKIEKETFSNTYGKFIIEPLERGFGITLGNSLRRILLSSIVGAAVTSVKIEGVTHEFATLPGVKEDVLQIIQNLKKLRVKLYANEERQAFIDERGPLEVKASHIKVGSEIEIVNPDLHIATLNDEKTRLSMQITIAPGRGYVEASENKKENQPVGTIPVDSIFTPVRKVKYEVLPARIGRKTSYDCLVMEIFTDGTIAPDEALTQAARILQDFTQIFILEDVERRKEEELKEKFLQMDIEEMGLPTSALNALKSAGINKVNDLITRNAKELLMINNFGEKSLEKLKKKLAEYNLSLRDE
ncbi:MAG TPA: DNA-directed RNA polymerase subunit alpha [Candidatus Aerophobetes bacterium]|uniref:DNA-directed RNA polymerase subunit alpha n=1 Tax=Aerophobetes bacterium TaxID=2030807 RepID=A0A7V5HZZ3_UNCAE|nr:DNA-directed RNA polymerase subunit alpha [Candidatus Aerophobetes bacterium]